MKRLPNGTRNPHVTYGPGSDFEYDDDELMYASSVTWVIASPWRNSSLLVAVYAAGGNPGVGYFLTATDARRMAMRLLNAADKAERN